MARACNLLSPVLGVEPAEVLDYPYALIGSIDAVSDRLVERRERYGVSYVTILANRFGEGASGFEDFAPVVQRLNGT